MHPQNPPFESRPIEPGPGIPGSEPHRLTGSVPLGRDLWEMAKPRLTSLVIFTTAVGFWLGSPAGQLLDFRAAFATLFGTSLVAAAASVLNQWSEREHDRRMARTQDRPLAAGRIPLPGAALYALAAGFAGLSLICIEANHWAAGIALLTLLIYVLAYTPLKRRHSLNTLVGAVPGALPPLIGWVAAGGELTAAAWSLFLILYIWQIPHFLAIAVLYRDEYAGAGFRMLPVDDPGAVRTGRIAVIYAAALIPASMLPALVGLGGPLYAAGALLFSIAFVRRARRFELDASRARARALFLGSIIYLPSLLILLCLDPTAPIGR